MKGEFNKKLSELKKETDEQEEIIKKVEEKQEELEKETEELIEEKEEELEKVEELRERQDDIIENRKKKVLGFFKQKGLWVFGLLIVAIILGVYIRSMPMHDHGGKPGLWDITRNDWTLGPDLDPWLFTRYAGEIVEQGVLPKIDTMRNVPLGFDPSTSSELLPYLIAYTYSFFNLFGDFSIEFAAAIFPVIMFAFTIIVFFLFVREIFVRKNEKSKTKANIIALISTFFMIVIPIFLSRTIAGIPEKESVGFFFMFLAFYLFLKAWKSDKLNKAFIFGILSGVSTAAMGLIWGGVLYVFITISVTSLIAFILNKVHKKEFTAYSLWLLSSWGLMILFSNRFSLKGLMISLDTGLASLVFLIFIIHFILWNTKFSKSRLLQNSKIPKNIISLIAAFLFTITVVSILLGPSFIIEKLKVINQMMFRPITGRWNTTVAENRQPFFTEWGGSFGPFIRNIPILFWMFFIGSVVLFKKMLNKIKKKDAWVLTGLYVLFFFGMVFSRYSGGSVFNGENFISKLFYYGSAILFIGFLINYYLRYHKEKQEGFDRIDYNLIFLFSLLVLSLFTARSAVRLIMVLAPIAPIFVSYLIIESIWKFKNTRDETWKIVIGIFAIIVILLSLVAFWNFYKTTKNQAYNMIPSYYNQQWQKAMFWVRNNTNEDTTVFAHWWDYGYWVQSIGERATVLDGGNAITYWNYLMGRHVLTGDNQDDALEFLYNHDTTHLLIDSSDIGKYGAFSSIGSDENFDRYSWIPIMVSDSSQTRETIDGEIRTYQGGVPLDEDITYDDNATKIFLPAGHAGVAGIFIETIQNNDSVTFKQPEVVFFYNGQQLKLPMRYIYFNGQFKDFKEGVEGCAYVIQKVYQSDKGLQLDNLGSLIWISPRVLRGYLAQKYLLDDPFNNFPNFKIVHVEQNLIVESLNSQGMNLNEFVYYNGLQGPIKIWEVKYTGKEKIKEEYMDTDASKYLGWEL